MQIKATLSPNLYDVINEQPLLPFVLTIAIIRNVCPQYPLMWLKDLNDTYIHIFAQLAIYTHFYQEIVNH